MPSPARSKRIGSASNHGHDPAVGAGRRECLDSRAAAGADPHFEQSVRRAPVLTGELLRRGWVTAYQANQLLQGHGARLAVGPYLLLERLCEGGTGQVFKARHRRLDKLVALKLIRKELLAEAEVVARFQREIQILNRLNHPNIIRAFDAGIAEGTHYLAMEFVEGTDLGKLVKRVPLPIEKACEYIRKRPAAWPTPMKGGSPRHQAPQPDP